MNKIEVLEMKTITIKLETSICDLYNILNTKKKLVNLKTDLKNSPKIYSVK